MIKEDIMNFEKDFNAGMRAVQLKRKYDLSNKSYRFLKERLNLKRNGAVVKEVKKEPTKNYYKVNTGGYSITKMINGNLIYFCHVKEEEQAKKVVEKLKDCNWNKSEIYRILYEVTNDL